VGSILMVTGVTVGYNALNTAIEIGMLDHFTKSTMFDALQNPSIDAVRTFPSPSDAVPSVLSPIEIASNNPAKPDTGAPPSVMGGAAWWSALGVSIMSMVAKESLFRYTLYVFPSFDSSSPYN
jgi:hypothetical protein